MLDICPVGPERFAEIAQIWNAVWPEFELDEEDLRHDNEREEHLRSRYWLASEAGAAVAFLELGPYPGSHFPGRWNLEIGVLAGYRGRGIGAGLFEVAKAEMAKDPIESASSRIREGDEAADHFAAVRGFTEVKRDFQSVLDLSKLDMGILEQMDQAVEGLEIRPARLADSPEFRRQMHELFERVRKDIPRSFPPTPLSFQDFDHNFFGQSSFLWNGSQIAFAGDEPVGFSMLNRSPGENMLHQDLTAVDARFRGLGVAKLLKARAMKWALAQGFKTVRTDNDSRNGPMLAINRKLGFEPLPATINVMWRPNEGS